MVIKVLSKVVSFEWDKGNIDKNLRKHNVTNQEAEEAFNDESKLILEDEEHSVTEKRYMIWGETNKGRKLTIFFTIRKDKVRVISARDMHRKERGEYEKI